MAKPVRTLMLAALAALGLGLPGAAQQAPGDAGRRLIVERGVDFPGGDLRAIYSTSLPICVDACLAEPACRALTFNAAASACFLKGAAGSRAPYPAALSARVVPARVVSSVQGLPHLLCPGRRGRPSKSGRCVVVVLCSSGTDQPCCVAVHRAKRCPVDWWHAGGDFIYVAASGRFPGGGAAQRTCFGGTPCLAQTVLGQSSQPLYSADVTNGRRAFFGRLCWRCAGMDDLQRDRLPAREA